MADGTQATDLGYQNNLSAETRHRNTGEIEIELDPALIKNAPAKNLQNSLLCPAK
jgi:hypothetical protein